MRKKSRRASALALAFIIVVAAAGAGIYWYESTQTCQSTSCQQVANESPSSGGSLQTQTTTTTQPSQQQPSSTTQRQPQHFSTITGPAYFDVWANFSDGSTPLHFTKQAALVSPGQFLEVNGHNITAITVRLRIAFSSSLPSPSYSGTILVYTCGACGNQEVYLGKVTVAGPVSKGVMLTSSFPSLQATSNLTLLAYPDGVSVATGGAKFILGMSPVAITSVYANEKPTPPAPPPTACPTSIPLYSAANPGQNWTPQVIGTATLLTGPEAAQALGIQGSWVGLLATYDLHGLSIFNVVAPGLGGSSYHPTYGLLSGYHYTSSGACLSY